MIGPPENDMVGYDHHETPVGIRGCDTLDLVDIGVRVAVMGAHVHVVVP